MKAINLFMQTRVNEDTFSQSYRAMSENLESVKPHELNDLRLLSENLMTSGAGIEELDRFWYSYRIPHISKEFDLLKIELDNRIVNIELKSQNVGLDKIQKQLLQNQSYLKHLKTKVISFTFVSEDNCIYELVNQQLQAVSFERVVEELRQFQGGEIRKDLDDYFKPNIFLVSPLTEPEKLLSGEYFLTDHQERFKQDILELIDKDPLVYGITGEPGTGKTLLLYDLAMELRHRGRCCVIHGAKLSEGHDYINEHCMGIDILPPKDLTFEIIAQYDYILVDEMQRIYANLNELILRFLSVKPIIVSFDQDQTLSVEEEKRAITQRVEMLSAYRSYNLTNSLRINRYVSCFYKTMFNLRNPIRNKTDFSHIDVVYAENEDDAGQILDLYIHKYDYKFLYCTCASDTRAFLNKGIETHRIIGQEFNNVITMVDQHFYYSEEGVLCAVAHENSSYEYVRMLYQNVTRTRDRLCILVYQNYKIFKVLLALRNSVLE